MGLPTILIIDDERDVLEFLSYKLKKEGFRVFTATNGERGLQKAIDTKADLIILDVMMGGIDGMEVCEKIRNNPQVKDSLIVFLTARNEDYSQLAGFEAGADDYIAKPVNLKILIRRINALLKRRQFEINRNKAQTHPDPKSITIDPEKHEVHYAGKTYMLPRKEYNLLRFLMSEPEKVFTRDEIFREIWGDTIVGERTIDVHIRKLRERFGSHHIVTVKGVGYKFLH